MGDLPPFNPNMSKTTGNSTEMLAEEELVNTFWGIQDKKIGELYRGKKGDLLVFVPTPYTNDLTGEIVHLGKIATSADRPAHVEQLIGFGTCVSCNNAQGDTRTTIDCGKTEVQGKRNKKQMVGDCAESLCTVFFPPVNGTSYEWQYHIDNVIDVMKRLICETCKEHHPASLKKVPLAQVVKKNWHRRLRREKAAITEYPLLVEAGAKLKAEIKAEAQAFFEAGLDALNFSDDVVEYELVGLPECDF